MKMDWRELSLREKIFQTVIPSAKTFYGKDKNAIKEFLLNNPVGGLFVGPEVIQKECCNVNEVKEIIEAFKSQSKVPPVFCADFETGCGTLMPTEDLTPYPDQMCLGVTRDKDLAYEYGKGTAVEALKLGVNWSFSPVVDINVNPFNAVVNVRSLGTSVEEVSSLAVNVIKGMQDYNLAATAKHFPGDGVDYRDQHFVTTANTFSYEEWKQQHGKVFQDAIDAGVMSIMTGHISLPDYQQERVHGLALPATLSYELTTKLLKEEMGFKGVVVSDALIMGGFRRTFNTVVEAEVESFRIGTDMMLWPSDEYVDEVEKAILSGKIPMSRLEDALERIWAFKDKLGLFSNKNVKVQESDFQKAKNVANEVAEKGIVLVRDRENSLPLKLKKVGIIGICTNEENYKRLNGFKKAFEKRGITVKMFDRRVSLDELEDCDKIIYALYLRPHQPIAHVDYEGELVYAASEALRHNMDKSVVVSFGSPYLIDNYFEPCYLAINAFSNVPSCYEAVVKGLLGEIQFKGIKNY